MTQNKPAMSSLTTAVVRLQAATLALTGAILGGLALFTMTIWLVIKAGPEVGPHLALLSQYFVGYSVTWSGAFVGFAYGALVGAAVGWAIGSIYNLVAAARHGH